MATFIEIEADELKPRKTYGEGRRILDEFIRSDMTAVEVEEPGADPERLWEKLYVTIKRHGHPARAYFQKGKVYLRRTDR